MKLTQTGVGLTARRLLANGAAQSAVQIEAPADGLTTFSLKGRLASDAPFFELATGTASVLQLIPNVSELQLEVTAGSGTVSAWTENESEAGAARTTY